MKVKIENMNGGSISVDIEMSDTPREIIAKAIAQNDQSDVAVIFADEASLREISNGNSAIDTAISSIALETKEGIAALDWDIPVGEQVKAQMGAIANAGREVEFVAIITQIAA